MKENRTDSVCRDTENFLVQKRKEKAVDVYLIPKAPGEI